MASIIKVNTIQDATNSNTAMTIDSSGNTTVSGTTTHTGKVLKTGNPCFRMSGVAGYNGGAGGTYTPPVNNSTPHNFSRTDYDVGSCIATSGTTAHTRFVAPVAGKYFFHSNITLGGISNDTESRYVTTYFYVNGAYYSSNMDYVREQDDGWGSGNAYKTLKCTDIIDMAEDDYFNIALGRSSSSDLSANIYDDGVNAKGDGKFTWLVGYLVG